MATCRWYFYFVGLLGDGASIREFNPVPGPRTGGEGASIREFNRIPGSHSDKPEDVRWLRMELEIYVQKRHADVLFYRDFRARRAGERHH